jgi:prepilin-type N-terminal cleavage/methylation domain-containing protein
MYLNHIGCASRIWLLVNLARELYNKLSANNFFGGIGMKKNAGFTLMELMISIAIFAILSGIAVPNMIRWRNNMQFNSAVRMVKSTIESTRMSAIKANMPARLEFTDGGHSFTTRRWDPDANALAGPVTHQLPPGVVLADSNFTGDQLDFTSRGLSGAGTLTLRDAEGDLCRRIRVTVVGTSRIMNCP